MLITASNPISDGWPAFGLTDGPAFTAPERVTGAVFSGQLKVGDTLSITTPPHYSGHPAPTVAWRWQMQDPAVEEVTTLQTDGAFVLTEAQAGMNIRVQDRAENTAGATEWASNLWSSPVEPADAPPLEP